MPGCILGALQRLLFAHDCNTTSTEFPHVTSLTDSVRLTGQDVLRGTFGQRHAAIVDTVTGQRYVGVCVVDEYVL